MFARLLLIGLLSLPISALAGPLPGIFLEWDPYTPPVGSAPVNGILLERAQDVAGSWAEIVRLPVTATGFWDTETIAGTTYHYRARAFNADAISDPSPSVAGSFVTLPQPDVPTIILRLR